MAFAKKTDQSNVSPEMRGGVTPNPDAIKSNLGIGQNETADAPGAAGVGKVRGPYKPRAQKEATQPATDQLEKYISGALCTRMVAIPYQLLGIFTGSKNFELDLASQYAKDTGENLKDVLLLFDLIKKDKDTLKWFAVITLVATLGSDIGSRWMVWKQDSKKSSGVKIPEQTTEPKNAD